MDWKQVISEYYGYLLLAIQIVKTMGKLRKIVPKEFSVEEIKEGLQSGELHFGDKIRVVGTFSEYVPFIDPKLLLKGSKSFPRLLPRTTRLNRIDDLYCGALFKMETSEAYAKEVLPIFYGIDSQMLEHTTGEMLEMNCRITQVPLQYRELINQNEYCSFEKEEGIVFPFGLRVENVEPYGIVDSFKISTWLVGSLNPAPTLKKPAEKSCLYCKRSFSYFPIDPVDFPPTQGCIEYDNPAFNKSKNIVARTERLFELERRGTPFVVFPDPFQLFEVFYPRVDLFDAKQKEHSKNILVGAVKQNMKELFEKRALPFDLERPKKTTLSVDFTYDQINRIAEQTFDPRDVPSWECPHWKPAKPSKQRARNA